MRPTGWAVLGLDADPVPGEPEQIRRHARAVSRMSGIARAGHDDLGSVVIQLGGNAWIGETGEQFRGAIGQRFRPALDLAGDSLGDVGRALTTWANDVDDAQRQADFLLSQATEATDEMARADHTLSVVADELDRAQRALDAAQPGSQAAHIAAQRVTAAQSELAASSTSVMAAQRRIDGAVQSVTTVIGDYATSASKVVAALKRSTDDTRPVRAVPKPGFWQLAGDATLDAASTIGNSLASFGNAMVDHPDEEIGLITGLLAMGVGNGIEAAGIGLDITVVGTAIGIPANVLGGAITAAGAVAVGWNTVQLAAHAGSDSAVSPFDTDRVMRAESPSSAAERQDDLSGFTHDEIRRAAAAPDRNGLTEAGRGLQKHSGRKGSVFNGLSTGSAQARNAQGMDVVDEILNDPNARISIRDNVTEVRDSRGRGIRMSNGGTFMGFLEPRE